MRINYYNVSQVLVCANYVRSLSILELISLEDSWETVLAGLSLNRSPGSLSTGEFTDFWLGRKKGCFSELSRS